jgi:murein DD-endopeptidase MepM/ murein hydrolase activator NlpD
MVVRHYNGLETLYGHLSKRNFDANTFVKAGDVIALGGNSGHSSGSHLHFEIMYEGNRFDPREIFFFPPNQIISDKFWLSPRVFDYLRGGVTRNLYELDDDAPKRTSKKMWIRVRSGDTLSDLARKFRTSPDNIAHLNRLSSRSKLRAGARIRVK